VVGQKNADVADTCN